MFSLLLYLGHCIRVRHVPKSLILPFYRYLADFRETYATYLIVDLMLTLTTLPLTIGIEQSIVVGLVSTHYNYHQYLLSISMK